MYNKDNKKFNLLNVLLGAIAIIIILFIVIWAVNKGGSVNNKANVAQFNQNIELMQKTAKEFFAANLPTEIGDSSQITLKEMYSMGIIDKLTYGKDDCDENDSYISITKTSDNEFRVKSNLVCADKTDNVTEKIKSNTIVKDKDGNVIADDKNDDVKLDVNDKNDDKDDDIVIDSGTSSDGKKADSTVNCTGPVCSFVEIPTKCTIEFTYEYVKRSVSCPEGYNINNGICTSSYDDVKDPTPSYTEEQTKITDAKVNPGEPYRVYTSPIIGSENGYYYCLTGDLNGTYCYNYTNKIISSNSSCPTGYSPVGNGCYKYANRNTSSSTSCPTGYTPVGNYCYKYANKSASTTTTTCPDGSTPVNGKCVIKTVTAVKSYTAWGNPYSVYSSRNKETTYTHELEKKVLLGSNKVGVSYVYNYAIYKRSIYYSCTQGELVNGRCYIYGNATTTTIPGKCPTGYTDNGTNCYIRTPMNTSTTSSCPAGYTDSGSTCYIRVEPNYTSTTNCPYGYTEDSYGRCYTKTVASYSGNKTYYKCPTGYETSGTGANTQCYKIVTTNDEYYCEDERATLKDKKCYLKIDAEFIENSCAYGYELQADNKCHKTTTNTANPIWTNVDYKYSKLDYLEGYQKTGKGTFVQTCTRIDNPTNDTIHYK